MSSQWWFARIDSTTLKLCVETRPRDASVDPRTGHWLEPLIACGFQAGDLAIRRTLLEIAEHLRGRAGASTHEADTRDDSRAIEILRQGADDGRLRVDAPSPRPALLPPSDIVDPWADDDDPPAPEPEPETAWFEVRVVDEVGDPIPDLRMSFTVDHQSQTISTDADGIARLEDVEGSYATVEVTAQHELRTILAPRWAQPRPPEIPESTDAEPVHVESLDDHFDPVGLHRRKPARLVITPRFACREVAATTFAFGKSFILREGIPSLAAIAQELQQDDGQQAMIFGHTDRSGDEALNKRLSERRGKAVFAMLTHDFEAWEDMWRARVNEHPWWERWGTRQLQHMLNALACPDDDGNSLGEDGDKGRRTNEAIRRFKRGDYPSCPAEQAPLPDNSRADEDLRRELFFAYAKLVAREPVEPARLVPVGGSPFMGCGEFNPLSQEARDEQSRRTVVFVFDPAAGPQGLPCAIANVDVCRASLTDPPAPSDEPEGEPGAGDPPRTFYRCAHYQQVATCCHSVGGPDLAHDVIVRVFMNLTDANALPHRFVLEAEDTADDDDDDDPDFRAEQSLSSDAKVTVEPDDDDDDDDDDGANDNDDANDDAPDPTPGVDEDMVELHFTHVPDAFAYQLRVEGVDEPYAVFVRRRFHQISELSAPAGVTRFPRIHAILNPPAPAPPEPQPGGGGTGPSGTP